MLEIITAYIEQHRLLSEQGKVVVAISGGADSLCLLHVLHQICGPGKRFPALQLHVAHLDHQLRGQASAEEALTVAQIAESWGLPYTIGRIDVPALAREERRSLEEAARTARYRFLRDVAQGAPIAVAHHMDDQVETLLLHLLRGGGLASMIGLQPRHQEIIRPLLAVTHSDTVAYCLRHDLTPLEDLSNTDPRFLRNRLRHELVPLLESMNPSIRETLLRNAEVMSVDLAWIEAQIDVAWPIVIASEEHHYLRLHLAPLLELPLSLQRHLLRRVMAHLCDGQSPLELRHYKLIEQLLHRKSNGETLTLHLPQQIHLMRTGNTVTLAHIDAIDTINTAITRPIQANEHLEIVLPLSGCMAVPGTPWIALAEPVTGNLLRAAKEALQNEDWERVWNILPSTRYVVYTDGSTLGSMLRIRTWRAGDRLRPLGMAHEKKVQDIFVDQHIPRAERGYIPLFFSATHCVWLAGIQLDDRVRLSHTTQSIVRLSIVPVEQFAAQTKRESEQIF